jgi:hypothetical protein
MHKAIACKDRRLFKRYDLEGPVLVTGDNLVGLIKNISCGGCAFYYVKKKEAGQDDIEDGFLCLEPLGMVKVRVQTVEDCPVWGDVSSAAGTMYVRRIRFMDLNVLQMRSLQEYIRRYGRAADEEKTELSETKTVSPALPVIDIVPATPGC